jgi:molybdopterin converting factor subunit 1
MQIHILAFGIAKDIIAGSQLKMEVADNATVADVRKQLYRRFPEFEKLASLRIAVNTEYAGMDQVVKENDEVVLIPPVSGG